MKLSIICTALLTAISVEAAAIAGQDDCFATGAPCHTLKRAAEAAANAMAEADPGFKDPSHHQCYGIGGMCFKAKREALAQAEAVAEAAAFASPRDDRHHQCYGIGGICFKAKRNALAAAEALAEIEVDADATVQDGESAS